MVFTPSGLSGSFTDGTSLLDAARQLGVDLDTVCGGRAICGRCQVAPADGHFAKWQIDSEATHLTPPNEAERNYQGKRVIKPGNRLGCQAGVTGNVVVDVPPESQIHRQVVRKDIGAVSFTVDPVVDLFVVDVPAGELEASVSEMGAICDLLVSVWAVERPAVDPRALRHVHQALKDGKRRVTCVVHLETGTVLDVKPGYTEAVYGIAVDVGSTTLAGYLCDLESGEVLASAGAMNPQIRFGEDLMSRVSYAMMNPAGAGEMTTAVRQAVRGLAETLTAEVGADLDEVVDLSFVGNPVMHHLLLGIDPTPLGVAPFALATGEAVLARADDLELDLGTASAYVLPCIGGHVGADTAGAVLAEELHLATEPAVLIDVGTNAEIVLTDGQRLFAASSPTGPALEGAQISCGVRATVGAIERIRIDRATLEPRYKVIGCDLWSDDPGFAAATRDVEVSGLAGSAIIEAVGELYLAGIMAPDGTITDRRDVSPRIEPEGRTFHYIIQWGRADSDPTDRPGPKLAFTQADVRAVQLAKAALRAGVDLLAERAGVQELRRVILAGAFGSHIDPTYALLLGLVPDNRPEVVTSVGNAAGRGAIRTLLSGSQRREVEALVARISKVETATEPRFQELFVDAMAVPHAGPTPLLAQIVDLPEPVASTTGGRRRRSGRRTGSTTETDGHQATEPRGDQ